MSIKKEQHLLEIYSLTLNLVLKTVVIHINKCFLIIKSAY